MVTMRDRIFVGVQGENLARTIEIDISQIRHDFPEAAVRLYVKRNGEDFSYAVQNAVPDGNLLKWQPTSTDTWIAGQIQIQIVATINGTICKTIVGTGNVSKSLSDHVSPEPPSPLVPWIERLEAASEYAERLENVEAETETLEPGEEATTEIVQTSDTTTFMFGIPKGTKGDTGDTGPEGPRGETGAAGTGIASIEKTGTSGLVDTYTVTLTDGTTSTFTVTNGEDGEVTEERLLEILLEYAKINGTYKGMTVGSAEQLISTESILDRVPYTFRTAGGSADIGNRKNEKIVGGTIFWNQLADEDATNTGTGYVDLVRGARVVSGHVYVVRCRRSATDVQYKLQAAYYTDDGQKGQDMLLLTANGSTVEWGSFIANRSGVSTGSQSAQGRKTVGNVYLYISKYGEVAPSEVVTSEIQLFDLTLMFGKPVADGLNTDGKCVEFFRNIFGDAVYTANICEAMSVRPSDHITTELNQYDPSTGKAKVLHGEEYQITGSYSALSIDGATVTPDDDGYFTPTVTGDLIVTGGSAVDTCIHLTWRGELSQGERDGDYEAYSPHVYELDDSLTLRGVPRLESGSVYYDGDEYASDGTVMRRCGIIEDLGASGTNWKHGTTSGGISRFVLAIPDISIAYDARRIATDAYAIYEPYYGQVASAPDNSLILSNSSTVSNRKNLYIIDSTLETYSTDAEKVTKLKEKLSGIKVVYLLGTPTSETADPYADPQIVDNFGTEQFVDAAVKAGDREVSVPHGHETLYQQDLRAKLEVAPNNPDGDGLYLMRQSAGRNEYVIDHSVKSVSVNGTPIPKTDGAVDIPLAGQTQPGTVAIGSNYASELNANGQIHATTLNTTTYASASGWAFVGKGTLENLLNAGSIQRGYAATTVSIPTSAWSGGVATVSVTGVTATNLVQLTPTTKASADEWGRCGVFCAGQASGSLTFSCVSVPTNAISLGVIIW